MTKDMIGYLSGTVLQQTGESLVIQAHGVGYEIFVPLSLLTQYHKGDEAEFVIYHDIREGINALYGFARWEDRALFKTLLSVSGVGPKTALAMFSMNDAEQIAAAINDQDIAFLSHVPGIGKRTAERISIELKEKVGTGTALPTAHNDAAQALESLGYKPREIREVLQTVSQDLPLEEQITAALNKLAS